MNGNTYIGDLSEQAVKTALRAMSQATLSTAKDHGFVDQQENCPRDLLFAAAHIALIHSEASEALEIIRSGDLDQPSKKVPGITALQDEFADMIIRVLMLGQKMGIDVGEGVIVKHKFNAQRPYRHGGKMF